MKNNIATQEDIKEIILQIEHKWPVDEWMINEVHIWPYVRIKLYIHFLMMMNKKFENPQKDSHVATKKKSIFKFSNIFNWILGGIKVQLFFGSLKRKKILFFGSHIHRVLHKEKYFNRFYDSLVEEHQLHRDVYMIEYQKVFANTFNKKEVITLEKHLKNYKIFQKGISKFSVTKSESHLLGYYDFYEHLKELPIRLDSLNISERDLVKWVTKIESLMPFFERFYRIVKPSHVVFLGYYGYDDIYAALLVANKMKIKSVDLQHGPQTNIHMCFSSWSKVPSGGFNLMPNEFWNWDENSKLNIDDWAIKTNAVKAKVVGQPYVSYWLKQNDKILSDERVILYSLQTFPFEIEDMLTPKIIELIKDLSYKWVLRLHPRNYLPTETIRQFLIKHEIEDKAIIQSSIDSALPEVLLSSVLHVTNFSGCLIEAHLIGVPTLLINNIGKEMFTQYIDNSKVFYVDQNEDNFILESKKIILNLNFNYKLNTKVYENPFETNDLR
ncbi:hypothetical protein [Flavobacterium sp. N3904]|uniref:hypothetical protein n=1 Tax=Flavobacterium sp. N3904 TaxID=2986835 RepID=UPI002224BC40|nr:hypothetical protein [Flavobacterium sp. N3904]